MLRCQLLPQSPAFQCALDVRIFLKRNLSLSLRIYHLSVYHLSPYLSVSLPPLNSASLEKYDTHIFSKSIHRYLIFWGYYKLYFYNIYLIHASIGPWKWLYWSCFHGSDYDHIILNCICRLFRIFYNMSLKICFWWGKSNFFLPRFFKK